MRSLLNLFVLLTAILCFGACEKEICPTSSLDVYVSGFEYDGDKYMPKYWKNGTPVPLSTGAAGGQASSIFVSGNDVYCAGIDFSDGGENKIKVWKNGVAKFLTNGTQAAGYVHVVVVGKDVYVASNEGDTPKYWKNGIPVVLAGRGLVTGIAVDGNDVYVSGTLNTDEIINTLGIQIAVYWKNGVQFALTDSLHSALATSIKIVDHNVYISGAVGDLTNVIPVYWKNGLRHDLPSLYDLAIDIDVSGNDVYVMGRGKYWKNDVSVPVENAPNQVGLSRIFSLDKDVYLSGTIHSGNSVATFWKNEVLTKLTNGTQNAYTSSIFVHKNQGKTSPRY